MRTFWSALCLVVLLGSPAGAGSDRFDWSPRYDPQQFKGVDRTIDPDGHIYGLPFGALESELVATFGEPMGVIVISDNRKGYLYGRSHMFVLHNGKLRELIIRENILDWQVAEQIAGHPFFDGGRWTLQPGIESGMDFASVATTLGAPHVDPDYRHAFDGESSQTELLFSSQRDSTGVMSFELYGVSVTHYGD